MTTLAALAVLLKSEVPVSGSVPTDAQYEQAVKDAVMAFSQQCGLMKIGSLDIVSGTAAYSLATDFLKMISVDALVGIDGVIVSNKLIPVSMDFHEDITIINKQITFYPTPAYTMTRYYKYQAAWVATAGDYTTLGDDEARIVLLKAKAIAYGKQANALSSGTMKYSLGAVSVDKSSETDEKRSKAESFDKEFLAACEKYNGAYITA